MIAGSLAGLGFMASPGDRTGLSWASASIGVALTNILAILYAERSRYWVDLHMTHAHLALSELSPQWFALLQIADKIAGRDDRKHRWQRSHVLQSCIHVLLMIVSIFLALRAL